MTKNERKAYDAMRADLRFLRERCAKVADAKVADVIGSVEEAEGHLLNAIEWTAETCDEMYDVSDALGEAEGWVCQAERFAKKAGV